MLIAGTQITMADGSTKNVEDVQENDILKGYDSNNDDTTVTVQRRILGGCNQYRFINSRIKITSEQLVLVQIQINRGSAFPPATYEKLLDVKNLQVGDNLVKSDGTTETVTSITTVDGPNPTLNFEIDGNELYIVEGVVVQS